MASIKEHSHYIYSIENKSFCRFVKETGNSDKRAGVIVCPDRREENVSDVELAKGLTDKLNNTISAENTLSTYGFNFHPFVDAPRKDIPKDVPRTRAVELRAGDNFQCKRHTIVHDSQIHFGGELYCAKYADSQPFTVKKVTRGAASSDTGKVKSRTYEIGFQQHERLCGVDNEEITCRRKCMSPVGCQHKSDAQNTKFAIWEAVPVEGGTVKLKAWKGLHY